MPLLRRLGATFRARKAAFTREYAEKVAAEFKDAIDDRQRTQRREGLEGSADDASSAGDDDADAALDDALRACHSPRQ